MDLDLQISAKNSVCPDILNPPLLRIDFDIGPVTIAEKSPDKQPLAAALMDSITNDAFLGFMNPGLFLTFNLTGKTFIRFGPLEVFELALSSSLILSLTFSFFELSTSKDGSVIIT